MFRFRSLVKTQKELFVSAAIAAIILALIAVTAPRLIEYINQRAVDEQVQAVQDGLAREQKDLEKNAQELAESETLLRFIEKNDSLGLLSITSEEVRKRKVGSIFIADQNGIVLSRTLNASRRGDYIFETTPYGRAVAEGKSANSIEAGITAPMSFIQGLPILGPEKKLFGGVFITQSTDSEYVKEFKRLNLNVGTELVFIGSKSSAITTSVEDPKQAALLQTYFGQDWDLTQTIDTTERTGIQLGGNFYSVRFIPVSGLETNAGKIALLVPNFYSTSAILLAGFLAFIFFLSAMILKSVLSKGKRRHTQEPLIATCSLILFALVFFGLDMYLKRQVMTLVAPTQTIYNSTLAIEPESSLFDSQTEQVITIKVTSGGEAINAVQAVLEYDPTVIDVLDILTEDSFCDQDFFLEKNIDRERGRVTIACIVPNPGYSELTGILAKIQIQPLQSKRFSLRFARKETMVLANDGLGTNVLRAVTDASYQIIEASALAPETSDALPILSPSHPNPERWYSEKKMIFSWPDVDGYRYVYTLNQNPSAILPKGISATNSHIARMEVAKDGVYYFHLFPKPLDGHPVTASTYTVRIDTIPPAAPTIKTSTQEPRINEVVRFEFSSQDAGSGLQSAYYVRVEDGIFLPIGSRLFVPFLAVGLHHLTVRAFDHANNFNDTTVDINVKSQSWFSRLFRKEK